MNKETKSAVIRTAWELLLLSAGMLLGALLTSLYFKDKEDTMNYNQSNYIYEEPPDWAEDTTLHSGKKNYLEYVHNKSE